MGRGNDACCCVCRRASSRVLILPSVTWHPVPSSSDGPTQSSVRSGGRSTPFISGAIVTCNTGPSVGRLELSPSEDGGSSNLRHGRRSWDDRAEWCGGRDDHGGAHLKDCHVTSPPGMSCFSLRRHPRSIASAPAASECATKRFVPVLSDRGFLRCPLHFNNQFSVFISYLWYQNTAVSSPVSLRSDAGKHWGWRYMYVAECRVSMDNLRFGLVTHGYTLTEREPSPQVCREYI